MKTIKKMKIYISGKITGIEKEAYELFEIAEKRLAALGNVIVNPMKLPHNHDKKYDSYMKECLDAMDDGVECIYLLKNWTDSNGAKQEFQKAVDCKMMIIFEK